MQYILLSEKIKPELSDGEAEELCIRFAFFALKKGETKRAVPGKETGAAGDSGGGKGGPGPDKEGYR